MEPANLVIVLTVASLVVVPLLREYADYRAAGLTRAGALATTLLLLPALAIGIGVALPFAERPLLQWGVIIAATVVSYSAAARTAVRAVPARASRARS